MRFGRFAWIGDGTKIRCHEGEVVIGPKTVIGQECTISAYRRVRIGEQCVIADRAMFIDFDHGMVEVERPIRVQGIYMREVEVGSNVWIGYGACVLRGAQVGDNSVVGTNSVVTSDVPANAVVGGVPARVLRMREAPRELRWPHPVEPDPEAETPCGSRRPGAPAHAGRLGPSPRRPAGARRSRAPPRSRRCSGAARSERLVLLGDSIGASRRAPAEALAAAEPVLRAIGGASARVGRSSSSRATMTSP